MGGPADDARKRRERAAGAALEKAEWVPQGAFRFRCNGPGVRTIVRGRVARGTHEGPLIEAAVGAYQLLNDPDAVAWPDRDGRPAAWVDGGATERAVARFCAARDAAKSAAARGELTPAEAAARAAEAAEAVARALSASGEGFRRAEPGRFAFRAGHLSLARPVLELGGGLGVSACRINRLLRRPTEHLVVERDARLLPLLRENARENRASFVALHAHAGLGPVPPAVAGQLPAPPLDLRTLLELAGAGAPVEVVCSLGGEEVEALGREVGALAELCARLVVTLHPYRNRGGPGPAARLRAALEAAGFVKLGRRVQTIAMVNPAVDALPAGDDAGPVLAGVVAGVGDGDHEWGDDD